MEREKTILSTRPKMFRNKPFQFILLIILCVASYIIFRTNNIDIYDSTLSKEAQAKATMLKLALLLPYAAWLQWWLQCLGTRLIVTTKRTILRKGILSKHTSEIRHADIRNIICKQSIWQRACGVGSIGVSSAGQGNVEIMVSGIASPQKVAETLRGYQS